MTAYPPALKAHLEHDVTTVCHCWKLTRADGAVLGFTDHDRTLTVAGTAFEPQTGFSASEARDTLGLAADTADVEGALSSDRIAEADIAAGLYDRATIETLLVNWRAPGEFALVRTATVGKIVRTDGRFTAELESLARRLDEPRGRYVTRACDAELGDARCGIDLALPAFSATATVSGLEGQATYLVTGLDAYADRWFSAGTLTWTSGAGAGRTERIEAHRRELGGVRLVLRGDGPASGVAGDTATVRAGCDKSFGTCKAKFANPLNFRGFPHLPGNDAAYGYVVDGGVFDGGPVVP